MGKLKEFYFSKISDENDDLSDLLTDYISSEEFDLMDEDQLDEIYANPRISLEE